MNLRLTNGRIPIYVGGNQPIILVDPPDRELFDRLFYKSRPEIRRGIYWDVLQARLGGKTLQEVATGLGVTRERVRQIEGKILRKLSDHWLPILSSEIAIPETIRPLHDNR